MRVDCTGYVGYSPNPSFDSLIAKIIVHAAGWPDAVRVLQRALAELHIAGVSSNVAFLQALAATPEFEANAVTTTFIEEHALRLYDPLAPGVQRERLVAPVAIQSPAILQQQQQLPASSIPLTSPIRGRISRVAVAAQGQVSAGGCVCALLCTLRPIPEPFLILTAAAHGTGACWRV